MQTELFGKKQLLQVLKDNGLPCTYPTLLKYERLGVISPPAGSIRYADRSWRAYTAEELRLIIRTIKEYKHV